MEVFLSDGISRSFYLLNEGKNKKTTTNSIVFLIHFRVSGLQWHLLEANIFLGKNNMHLYIGLKKLYDMQHKKQDI